MTIETKTVLVPRSQMRLADENPRTYLGPDLRELGKSVDKRQEEPLRASYEHGANKGILLIYDGQRRLASYDAGYMPKRRREGGLKTMIYTDESGCGLSAYAMWDICAEINRHRRNWTELEEGRYLARKMSKISSELRRTEPALALIPEKLRRAALERVASESQLPESTVEDRLKLIQFPEAETKVIEKLLGERVIGATTLVELIDAEYSIDEVLAIIDEAAKQKGYPINWEALKIAPVAADARKAKQPTVRVTRRQVGLVLRRIGAPTRKTQVRPVGDFKREIERLEKITSGEGSRTAVILVKFARWCLYLEEKPPLV